ncbi:uncharacterized protein [Heliangelus exortis]|uniref:uncharacterized protein n=1 Tax=Heliangelus exortis TaxID=472823 RepID=UPI003A8E6F1D
MSLILDRIRCEMASRTAHQDLRPAFPADRHPPGLVQTSMARPRKPQRVQRLRAPGGRAWQGLPGRAASGGGSVARRRRNRDRDHAVAARVREAAWPRGAGGAGGEGALGCPRGTSRPAFVGGRGKSRRRKETAGPDRKWHRPLRRCWTVAECGAGSADPPLTAFLSAHPPRLRVGSRGGGPASPGASWVTRGDAATAPRGRSRRKRERLPAPALMTAKLRVASRPDGAAHVNRQHCTPTAKSTKGKKNCKYFTGGETLEQAAQEVVGAPSLEVFSARLDGALSNLV